MMTTNPGVPRGRAAARQRQRHSKPSPGAALTPRTESSGGDGADSSSVIRRRHRRGGGDGSKFKRGGPSSGRCSPTMTCVAVGAMILVLVFVLYVYASYLLRVASILDGRNAGHRRRRHHRDSSDPSPPAVIGVREMAGDGWTFDRGVASEVQRLLLISTGRKSPILTAYVEPPLSPPTPKKGSDANLNSSSFVPRLALRTHGPEALRRYTYPRLTTCDTLPSSLPVDDHGLEANAKPKKKGPTFPHRYEYARKHCPVDADPFLPWIHDVFPSSDGKYVEFVSHNRRRCNTDAKVYTEDLMNLEPQVTIMQPVPLKRLTEDEATVLAPDLWRPKEEEAGEGLRGGSDGSGSTGRYRLASYGEADPDSSYTRFICRFHANVPSSPTHEDNVHEGEAVRSVLLGETLSVYPYNYEFANHRKPQHHPMLTGPPDRFDNKNRTNDAHNEQFWNAVLHFRCPVPRDLRESIASGETVVDDVATIYVDLVPVRTYPRTDELGYLGGNNRTNFDPDEEWGRRNVLPRVEVSGRWTNIPICRPPVGLEDAHHHHDRSDPVRNGRVGRRQRQDDGDPHPPPLSRGHEAATAAAAAMSPTPSEKRHQLVACTWASASFHTRGNNSPEDTSTPMRLLEWLTYHLYVADFDHVYVYDNSAPSSHVGDATYPNPSSLKPIVDLFPSDRVTRIEWPFRVCNNNPPAHSNPGERSSQYAAETSCRLRYGPHTEWMSFLDVDEYIVPQSRGNKYGNSIKRWLMDEDVVGRETMILSFFQTRAKPNLEFMERASRDRGGGDACAAAAVDASPVEGECPLLTKRHDVTYLETYDCDPTPLPKPGWGWRAKKQIYRPWYVLYHHVHYPTVTRRLIDQPDELSLKYNDKKPYERRVDELTEAFMIHAKTTSADSTFGWRDKCRGGQGGGGDACPVGIPWPGVDRTGTGTGTGGDEGEGRRDVDPNGMAYNCHRHGAMADLLPRLREELDPLLERYNAATKR